MHRQILLQSRPSIAICLVTLLLAFNSISVAIAQMPITDEGDDVLSIIIPVLAALSTAEKDDNSIPNFLIIVSDDQSWEHTSYAGYRFVNTPNFDRIAAEGVYFRNAYVSAPSCTPSRSAMLTGRHFWELGSAALLHGSWPADLVTFQDLLADAGYHIGSTGRGWGPGLVVPGTRPVPPAGRQYNSHTQDLGPNLGSIDLAKNFEGFLAARPTEATPFSFWAGSTEPHRPYDPNDGSRLADAVNADIPGILPNTSVVRRSLSGYLEEIEQFDREVGQLVAVLEQHGLLDSTMVIVTSDNGMPMSRAKTQNYQYGVRVPLAVRWGARVRSNRIIDDMVSLTDLAPTILEGAALAVPNNMTGRSFLQQLESRRGGSIDPERDAVFTGYERHACDARAGGLTYPRRAIHTPRYVYIRNYLPDRWPAGDPPAYIEAYSFLLRAPGSGEPIEPQFSLSVAKRPAEELFDLQQDPYQSANLATDANLETVKEDLAARLTSRLRATGDPTEIFAGDQFSGTACHD